MHKPTNGKFVDPSLGKPLNPPVLVQTDLLEPLCAFVNCHRDADFDKTTEVMILGTLYEIKICSEHYMALKFVV